MAKLAYSKLKLSVPKETKTIPFESNGETYELEVKTFLPLDEKIALIERVISAAEDDMHFYNTMKLDTYLLLEIVQNYTNISFSDKVLENPSKLYDELMNSIFIKSILCIVDEKGDYTYLKTHLMETVDNIYKYNNSALGIMHNITNDFDGVTDNLEEIQNKIGGSNLEYVKDILTKLK